MKTGTFYTSSRNTLLSYDYVEQVLHLDAADRNINQRILNDSFQDIAFYLGTPLEHADFPAPLPEELKEAALTLFIRKQCMYKKAADYAAGDEMDDVLETKFESGALDFDDFFDRFSTIPYEVELILDTFKKKRKRQAAVRSQGKQARLSQETA